MIMEMEEYRKNLVEFIENEINKKEYLECFKKDIWTKCAQFGILSQNVGQEYGGLDFDFIVHMMITETLGYACNDSGFVFALNNHLWPCQYIISKFGNKEVKEQYLPKMIKGELIGAFAMTESNAGSDIHNLNTTVSEKDDVYILSGKKSYISNGSIADLFLVVAKDINDSFGRSCILIVNKATKGLRISEPIDKMGLKACPMSEIYFEDCIVPKKNVLATCSSGMQVINCALEYERFFEFVSHVGKMKRIMNGCIKYADMREAFGKKIGEYQAISHKISNMCVDIELAEALMERIAKIKIQGKSIYYESSIFKLFVSESYVKLCENALQIYGAYGYTKDSGIERELRDSLASRIYSGSSEIQRNIIFRLKNNFLKGMGI